MIEVCKCTKSSARYLQTAIDFYKKKKKRVIIIKTLQKTVISYLLILSVKVRSVPIDNFFPVIFLCVMTAEESFSFILNETG